MLVPARHVSMLRDVKSLDDLTAFSLLSSSRWPEPQFYKNAGFTVIEEDDYENLFIALQHSENSIFPRMALMVSREKDNRKHLDLAVDPFVLLTYPYTLHFYLPARDTALIDALEKGLAILDASGGHKRLLDEHYGDVMRLLNVPERTVIAMPLQSDEEQQ